METCPNLPWRENQWTSVCSLKDLCCVNILIPNVRNEKSPSFSDFQCGSLANNSGEIKTPVGSIPRFPVRKGVFFEGPPNTSNLHVVLWGKVSTCMKMFQILSSVKRCCFSLREAKCSASGSPSISSITTYSLSPGSDAHKIWGRPKGNNQKGRARNHSHLPERSCSI